MEDYEELLLSMYVEGKSMKEMQDIIGVNQYAIRRWFISEGLKIRVKDRAESYEQYLSGESIETKFDVIETKALQLEKSLQHSRNELNYHRATKRRSIAKGAALDKFTSVLSSVVDAIEVPELTTHAELTANIPMYGLIAVMSDIHLGEVVTPNDVPDNEYNYEVAKLRIERFTSAILNSNKQSKRLIIADLKDILKGVIHGGMWETEGSVIESIAKAVELYTAMLNTLRAHYEVVELYSTGSNHERLTDDIKTTNKHLDYGRLIDLLLKQIITAGKWDNVIIHTTDTGYQLLNVNTANILLMHGDTQRTYSPTTVAARSKLQDTCIQLFGKPYRHAISGHTHSFISATNQYKGLNIVNGTMVGNTSYGVQSGFSAITPCQTLLFVESDGRIEDVKVVHF